MPERILIHRAQYHDSAYLMRLSRRLAQSEGISEAVVVMATEMNRALLASVGFRSAELDSARPLDLVVALRGKDLAALERAGAECERLLSQDDRPAASGAAARPASLREALREHPQAELVSVAVPGEYAGHVARQAIEAGRHVFLFSNNVPLEQEIALKREARARDLLLMGPDCGTAILGGVGLGFANRVRRGPVGLVGASGTGLQEVSSLLHQLGSGVSHAIGTGSRDLSAEVGAMMTEAGLRLLAADPDTRVIGLIAKHPAQEVAERLHRLLAGFGKPVVVRFLGQPARSSSAGVKYADSLEEAACLAARLSGAPRDRLEDAASSGAESPVEPEASAPGRLVGLFGGGSLASEAALTLRSRGLPVEEPGEPLLPGQPLPGAAHLVVDCGEEFYTRGKPHPMVDQTVRCELIRRLGADPAVGVLLFDLVLGDGAHPDPAPELAQALEAARAARGRRPLRVFASVTGTELDPQDANRQRGVLERAGARCFPSAWRAAVGAADELLGVRGKDA
ncbi:MAG: acyl-CoA synthetase FdrA [Myxococcales bacterium]|nr:acyl-CoA synthetase FdrA [Myxococcales bacterium]